MIWLNKNKKKHIIYSNRNTPTQIQKLKKNSIMEFFNFDLNKFTFFFVDRTW